MQKIRSVIYTGRRRAIENDRQRRRKKFPRSVSAGDIVDTDGAFAG